MEGQRDAVVSDDEQTVEGRVGHSTACLGHRADEQGDAQKSIYHGGQFSGRTLDPFREACEFDGGQFGRRWDVG